MTASGTRTVHMVRHRSAGPDSGPIVDELAAEEPLEMRVEGQSVAITMRTPGHDLDLTTGNAQFMSGSNPNTLAAGMLSSLGGGMGDFLGFAVLGATNPDKQDVLIVVPGPAGLMAIAGLGLVRRRRRA